MAAETYRSNFDPAIELCARCHQPTDVCACSRECGCGRQAVAGYCAECERLICSDCQSTCPHLGALVNAQ